MQKLKNIYGSLIAIALLLSSTLLQAQEDANVKIDVTKTDTTTWYTNPIVWIVGGAVFILLLVALLRSGKKD